MISAILPWPTREQRRQSIAVARRDRIAAERKAEAAKAARRQLERRVAVNGIAEAIAQQIRKGRE